jgi:hypothetical protein
VVSCGRFANAAGAVAGRRGPGAHRAPGRQDELLKDAYDSSPYDRAVLALFAEFVRTAHRLAREKRWTSVSGGLAPIWLPPDDPAISALMLAQSP